MIPLLQFITDFGDQALLLPLALGVLLVFTLARWRRGALAWAVAVGGTLGFMLLLKLHFLSCSRMSSDYLLRTPSGHTAASAAIYGGLLAILARLLTGHMRWTIPCTLVVALVIGGSRVLLGVHTPAEVVVGAVVGVAGAVAATLLAGPPPRLLRLGDVAVLSGLILALLHGLRMPAEAAIRAYPYDLIPIGCY